MSRPSLLVFFRCANLYRRVYREANGREYLARCPKCGRSTRFIVGEGGTGQRAFEVQCG